MKSTLWAALLLGGLAGCFPIQGGLTKADLQKAPAPIAESNVAPRTVSHEQVNERNAHQQCEALTQELDREVTRPR